MFKIAKSVNATRKVTIIRPTNIGYDPVSGRGQGTSVQYIVDGIITTIDTSRVEEERFSQSFKVTLVKADVDKWGGINERCQIKIGENVFQINMVSTDQLSCVYIVHVKGPE